MIQGKAESSGRINSRVALESNAPFLVHIFGSVNPLFERNLLIDALQANNIEYDFHVDYRQLAATCRAPQGLPRLVLLETAEVEKGTLEEELRRAGLQQQAERGLLKLFTYPSKVPALKIKCLGTPEDVIQQYRRLLGERKRPRVELKGLSSRSKEQSFSKDKSKPSPATPYQRIYYYSPVQNDYHVPTPDIYEKVTDIFQKESTYQPFPSVSALAESKERAKVKKSLLVIPANGSEQLLREIAKRWKEKEVEVVVVGRAEANEFYLNKNIVLVTNSPLKLYEYLQHCQLISPHLIKSLFENLIHSEQLSDPLSPKPDSKPTLPKPPPKQPQLFGTREVDSEYQLAGKEGQSGQSSAEGRQHKVKKLKSPLKGRPNGEGSEQAQSPNISVHPPSPGPITETSEFRTNKQGEVIPKRSLASEQPHSSPNISNTHTQLRSNLVSSSHEIGGHQTESPSMKNSLPSHYLHNIHNKYRSSNIIPETSDEYRGSNKDSLLNLDDNKAHPHRPPLDSDLRTRHYTHLEVVAPLEEVPEKKMVYSLVNNAPDRHLLSSQENTRHLLSSAENTREVNRSGVTTGGPVLETEGEGRHLPKPKVLRKEDHLAPLEVKIESSNRLEEQHFGSQSPKPAHSAYGQQRGYAPTSPTNYSLYQPLSPNSPQPAPNQQTTANQQQTTTSYQPAASNPQLANGSVNNFPGSQPQAASNSNSSERAMNALNYHSSASMGSVRGSQFSHYQPNGLQGNPGVAASSRTETLKAGEVRVLTANSPPSNNKNERTSYPSTSLNLEGYERVEVNGITMYRKKADSKPTTDTHQRDGSPKVVRYEVSPRRHFPSQDQRQPLQLQEKPAASRYPYSTYNTYNTQNSYTPQTPQDSYNRSSTYYPSHNTYESYKPMENRGSTYHPQPLIQREGTVQRQGTIEREGGVQRELVMHREGGVQRELLVHRQREGESKEQLRSVGSTENVSIKLIGNEDEFITKISNIKGELKEKAEVERREYKDFKVEAPNPKTHHLHADKRESKELKVDNTLRLLNDSNWVSKTSQLLSDGSILRRNNIRFGIKLKQKQEKFNESVMNETKLFNAHYNINDLNRKMALHRKILGDDQLLSEHHKYTHIDTHLSAIHYLFQEQLRYYEKKVNALFGPLDKVDFFACLEELSQKAFSLMDCGFVVMVHQEALKVNPSMLPENYYVILIEKGEDPLLEIDEDAKRIRMDSLERLTLAAKIILDSKLNKCVLYKVGDALVEGLGDKFAGTQFQTEKLEIELTNEVLDCFYQDEPRLTRLYIFCLEEQLARTLRVIDSYEKSNDLFARASCKVICPLKNGNNLSRLKKDYPAVVFLSSLSLTYREILEEAHRHDPQVSLQIKPDRLYLHDKQQSIAADLQKYFPGRFEIILFDSLQAVSKKTSKFQLQKFNSYLVLSDSLAGEKLAVENFTKVFMLGRAKALPNNVVRVMKKEELIELLKK